MQDVALGADCTSSQRRWKVHRTLRHRLHSAEAGILSREDYHPQVDATRIYGSAGCHTGRADVADGAGGSGRQSRLAPQSLAVRIRHVIGGE